MRGQGVDKRLIQAAKFRQSLLHVRTVAQLQPCPAEQLAQLGKSPEPDSILHARFAEEVSSATAQRGNVIAAVLTEPLFSQDHHLLLPANSRIAGEVIKVKPARKLHHNGWISAKAGETDTGRQARFYAMTKRGRAQLDAETANWDRATAIVARVVKGLS